MRALAGVATMDDWTAGDYVGLVGGAVAALAALGNGIAWLLNWRGAREDRRAAKLQKWEESLNRREQDYRETIEHRLAEVGGELERVNGRLGTLGVALFDVSLALRDADPENAALVRVVTVLRTAFPTEDVLPEGVAALLARLDRREAP